MTTITRFLAAAACALPFAAFAQTPPAVVPADAPRSQLERDQTQNNGDATKYGAPTDATKTRTKTKAHAGMKHDASGAVDGTPATDTSTSSTSAPTTTPSPTTPTAKNSGK